MVRLTKIYTRTGDGGRTALGDGKRVAKTHPRIAAYGCVDELNAVIGLALAQRGLSREDRALLRGIQNDLFDVGADLCVPRLARERAGEHLRITSGQVEALESALDARNEKLAPLTSFVLPGGRLPAAWLHMARVVCRRAELAVARLIQSAPKRVGTHVLPYLNRLSDLLFVMARVANDGGRSDVLWKPGAGQTRTDATPVRKRARRRSGGRRAPG
ncbi:MAG: cob(I)yrinic acid a,c-diamide adenosyltransferase [Candidatus Latescibacterota bacterium]|nr:MAG: cob(I)yrinic acid a,c-diamide adenosyltransferase [Candidatus Latescibacterota bacterium]